MSSTGLPGTASDDENDEEFIEEDDVEDGIGGAEEPIVAPVDEDLVDTIEPDDDDALPDDTVSIANDPTAEDEQDFVEDVEDVDAEDEVDDVLEDKARVTFSIVERTAVQIHKNCIRVPMDERITSDSITQTEMTELINIRCSQVANTGISTIDIAASGLSDPIQIAKLELAMRQCPLILRRIVWREIEPKTGAVTDIVEDWNPNDMLYPSSVQLPSSVKHQ